MMEYKGFYAEPYYSQEDGCFVGRILGINDIVSFEGSDANEIEARFQEAVEHHIETCKQLGQKPQKSFSGKFNLRLSPDLHARLAATAQKKELSLNQYISEVLSREVG